MHEAIATVGAGVHPSQLTVKGDGQPVRDARFEDALEVVKALADAARNRVLASSGVAMAGADHFECVEVAEGAVLVKGELAPARRRVAGRRDLFRLFGELLAKAANEGAQVVTVTGPAGIGKTRFLEGGRCLPAAEDGAPGVVAERAVPLSRPRAPDGGAPDDAARCARHR